VKFGKKWWLKCLAPSEVQSFNFLGGKNSSHPQKFACPYTYVHGIPMKEKSGTSENIIRTFISEKLHFSASNLDRIIFSNVHRIPQNTSTIASSVSVQWRSQPRNLGGQNV